MGTKYEPPEVDIRDPKMMEKFQKAQKLYDDAWTVEKKCVDKSKTPALYFDKGDGGNLKKFGRAASEFQSILLCDPYNKKVLSLVDSAKNKVRGNEKLKSALTCHRQALNAVKEGNVRFAEIRWRDAEEDYLVAKNCFEKGLHCGGAASGGGGGNKHEDGFDGIIVGGDEDVRFRVGLKVVLDGLETVEQVKDEAVKNFGERNAKAKIEREMEKETHAEILRQLEQERKEDGLLRVQCQKAYRALTPAWPFLPVIGTVLYTYDDL